MRLKKSRQALEAVMEIIPLPARHINR